MKIKSTVQLCEIIGNLKVVSRGILTPLSSITPYCVKQTVMNHFLPYKVGNKINSTLLHRFSK